MRSASACAARLIGHILIRRLTLTEGVVTVTNRNWKILKFVAMVGTGAVALHGAKTRKWRLSHTVFVITGAVATIGAALTERQTEPAHSALEQGARRGEAPSAVA
jgi:hypothetical protein